jgi:bacterioferritin
MSKGTDIIKLDVKKLILVLNKAFADEWLAYYQYWLGAQVVRGPMQSDVTAELMEHASEELAHAQMLVDRILQLGGTPILDPADLGKFANCAYAKPKDPKVRAILKQNIDGERCAIDVYNKLVELTRGKDEVTYQMAASILGDEVKHENDLETLLDDIGK